MKNNIIIVKTSKGDFPILQGQMVTFLFIKMAMKPVQITSKNS